jgi:hypothetical protein
MHDIVVNSRIVGNPETRTPFLPNSELPVTRAEPSVTSIQQNEQHNDQQTPE